MEYYQLKTTLFGEIVVPVQKGLFEYFTIMLGGKEISTALYIMETFLNDENNACVLHFLEQVPVMYEIAKNSLRDCCDTNATVSFFIESSIDVDDDDYRKYLMDTFDEESIEQITKEVFIGGLQPRCIRIGPDKDNKIDCVFDFSLDEDYTDELLVVYFNEKLEITGYFP